MKPAPPVMSVSHAGLAGRVVAGLRSRCSSSASADTQRCRRYASGARLTRVLLDTGCSAPGAVPGATAVLRLKMVAMIGLQAHDSLAP